MLENAYKLQEKVTVNPPTIFNDLKEHWSEKYVNILVELGISSGYGNVESSLIKRLLVLKL